MYVPSWTYSIFVAFTLLCSEAGTGGAGILAEKVFESKVSIHEVSILSTASACNQRLIYRQRNLPADQDHLYQRTHEISSS